ncbi:MAG: secondary thiamine-phosphate synthase enzyme YjbQ [Patescibacteria group bacterium]|nr:secondary thiamine-phosphate synthase enzyme YjbQ [Patescibacteria group bacterium]
MELTINTGKKKQVIDITDAVNRRLAQAGTQAGICHLFLKHTTAALATADLDPGTDLDMLDAFDKIVPRLNYRHPHNPSHAPDHILSSVIGASLAVPVKDGKLDLGTWQRAVLVELDGPRERDMIMSVIEAV